MLQIWFLEFIAGPGGYVGLFLFGALATTLVPLSPEAIAIGVWSIGMPVLPVILILMVSNYLGNALNYWIGYYGRGWIEEKYFPAHTDRFNRAQELFERYGSPVLLFSWLPFIGDPITFIPGIVRYNFLKFTVYVLISKAALYVGLWYLAGRFIA